MNKDEIKNEINIKDFIIDKLEDKKAENIIMYSKENFNITSNYVFIASGRSTKNVCAIADNLSLELKKLGISSSIEGMTKGEWVLVDCADAVVHIFYPDTRLHYNLEELYNSAAILK